MPSEKSARASQGKRDRKRPQRSATRTILARARESITSGKGQSTNEAVSKAIQSLDRAASKGLIHPNNAARKKSRLMKQLSSSRPSE